MKLQEPFHVEGFRYVGQVPVVSGPPRTGSLFDPIDMGDYAEMIENGTAKAFPAGLGYCHVFVKENLFDKLGNLVKKILK